VPGSLCQREFFIDNLLVQIHFSIVLIRWTSLAPWEFEFPFPASLASTFLTRWATSRSSEVNFPDDINVKTLRGIDLVTYHADSRDNERFVVHRVGATNHLQRETSRSDISREKKNAGLYRSMLPLRVSGFGFWISGFGFRDSGFKFQVLSLVMFSV